MIERTNFAFYYAPASIRYKFDFIYTNSCKYRSRNSVNFMMTC